MTDVLDLVAFLATPPQPPRDCPVTEKEPIIEMIRRMPDDATTEDILYATYVRAEIDEGIRQLNNGERIPHAVVMDRMRKWLR